MRDYNFTGPIGPGEPTKPEHRVVRIDNPAAFYEQNATQLAAIGADAFGQPVELFAPQVQERFKKAEFGHAMYAGDKIVGFGLFDMLRGRHWQSTLYRG